MRTKNPGLMTQIQDFVNDFFFREYRMPSVQEIATATGIAKSSAHRYLVEMDKRGILSYRAGEILTDMVNGLSFAIKNTPLTGGITCGLPVEENPRVEEYIPLPTAIFGNKDMFILKAYGDSMTGVGISSGDYVVIQRQTYARPEGTMYLLLITTMYYAGVDACNEKLIENGFKPLTRKARSGIC